MKIRFILVFIVGPEEDECEELVSLSASLSLSFVFLPADGDM
jgi:hypothetical protein